MTEYEDFLANKLVTAETYGMDVNEADLHPYLFDWQRRIVAWSLRKGRSAVFLDTGLGKTLVSLEWARHVPGRVLILAPLAVAPQTVREGRKIGLTAVYCRSQEEADAAPAGAIIVTNYEMLGAFDASVFAGVVCDESSIMKNQTGKIRNALVTAFAETPYRLACTATPAPNDHVELGNHAEFLGVMEVSEMLSRWFKHDSGNTSVYRLKRHAQQDFWRWVASWAVCASKPSDLGDYSDEGFILPPLTMEFHPVDDGGRSHEAGRLFHDGTLSATEMWSDKAETAEARCKEAAVIVANRPDVPWIVWCETNIEADYLKRFIPEATEVRGSETLEAKERKLDAFSSGTARIIVSKPRIAGAGLNWQHCSDMVFVGLSYSWERLYQAIRRCYRFGQTRPVTAHLISADSEAGIIASVQRKAEEHEGMVRAMVQATHRYGLGSEKRATELEVPSADFAGEDWELKLGDSCQRIKEVPDNSVGLSVYSPPFANLYVYSPSLADMGNCAGYEEFFEHFGFLAPELLRVTMPGRLMCVHCADLPLHIGTHGVAGIYDFPGALIRCFSEAGWTFHSRITIWKNPASEVQRTKAHGLLHKNFVSRAETVRQGIADYILVFRAVKGDVPDKQVTHDIPEGQDYIGTDPPPSWKDQRDWSVNVWQRYASPVWFDINQSRVLEYAGARSEADERHICPLQLDVIDRCIDLWSNPGDIVFDPFAGVGSTGYSALQRGRRFSGIELKPSYAGMAVRHLERAIVEKGQESLFGDEV